MLHRKKIHWQRNAEQRRSRECLWKYRIINASDVIKFADRIETQSAVTRCEQLVSSRLSRAIHFKERVIGKFPNIRRESRISVNLPASSH